MYSFEGDFRRKPRQSLGGLSVKEKREDLLQRAIQERQKREEFRRKVNSAIKIQAVIRGHLIRIKQKRYERIEFDALKAKLELTATENGVEPILLSLLQKFLFFYNKSNDSSRLVWLCQMILRHLSKIVECLARSHDQWLFKLVKFQKLCLEYLLSAVLQKQSFALPLRIIEVFLDKTSYLKNNISEDISHRIVTQTVLYLVKNGYYSCLRFLVDSIIPNTIEFKVTASTARADSLLQLLLKPLSLVPNSSDNFKNFVLREFSSAFFCQPFSCQVLEFIIPSLLQDGVDFPFVDFINAMLSKGTEDFGASRRNDVRLGVRSSPYLLYCVLTLASKCRTVLADNGLWAYLQLLQLLMPTLNFHMDSSNDRNVSSDSEDEDNEVMDTRQEFYLPEDPRAVIENSTRLVNEPFHVQLLLLAVEKHQDGSNLMALCHLCHSLLMHHRFAIYKYRLLHTLAFKPGFLRYLWHSVANMSSSSLFGSPTPLLQLLSRGLSLTVHERNLIAPVLVLFCSLLEYLFQTLHDSEFYGICDIQTQENQSSNMPFTLTELAAVSLSLRDLCLGLIELMNPISRPIITDEYTEAVMSIDERRNFTKSNPDVEEQCYQQWTYLFKVAVGLIRQLHSRDTRKSFCPHEHWIAKRISIPIPKANDWHLQLRGLRRRMRFNALRGLVTDDDKDGPPLSIVNIRNGIILRELPFLVPFHDRVLIFQHLVYKDKREVQSEATEFLTGPQIQIQVRRNYLYEDGFDKLSPQNGIDKFQTFRHFNYEVI